MTRFEELVAPLAADAERVVLGLVAALHDPEHPMGRDEFVEAVTTVIGGARSRARVLALAIVQEAVEASLGATYLLSPATAVGAVERDTAVLAAVVAGVLDDEQGADATPARLGRLARSEPLYAAQEATQGALIAEPVIVGWTRDLEGDACQLCRWWWREGRVWSPEHRMPTHKGCACSQLPVTK